MGGACSAYGGEEYIGFWWGKLWERSYYELPGLDGRIILRWIFKMWDFGVWTVSTLLRIGTGGGHLYMR